jgi:hypothetical protein
MMPTKATGENELKRKELKLKQLKGKEDESARKCEESLKVKEQKRFVHLFTLFVTSAGVLISLCRISNAAGNTRVERSVPWQGIPMRSERSVPRQRFFFFFFFKDLTTGGQRRKECPLEAENASWEPREGKTVRRW